MGRNKLNKNLEKIDVEKMDKQDIAENISEIPVEVVVEKQVEKPIQSLQFIEPIAMAKGDSVVKIRPKETFRAYIGNRYWDFVKGETMPVPKSVKEILAKQGALDVL
jgi:hypothetical protein